MLKEAALKQRRDTKRDRQRLQWWATCLITQGNSGSKMRQMHVCVGKSREESEGEKEVTGEGRERWEDWRVICGSHGPENELLVLKWLNVCMRAHTHTFCVCVCVIRVPQSAETKGVSPWHLLSPPKHDTPPGRETEREKGGGKPR